MDARQRMSERAAELAGLRVPYVHAQVVLAERPTSAKPGDEAIVLADGTIEGFVGGACAVSTVRSRALALLDSGESALLRITPRAEEPAPGKLVVHNPCLSGGTLEIFLQAVVPAPLVLVAGDGPVARALLGFGPPLGYSIQSWCASKLTSASAVVVASHGSDEEAVLCAALGAGVGYVGLVASPTRGGAVIASLPVCPSQAAAVSTPAGLDLGARSPEEIALSILAEIVAHRPRPAGGPRTTDADRGAPASAPEGGGHANVPEGSGHANAPEGSGPTNVPEAGGPANVPDGGTLTAIDPVCSMTVAAVEATLHLDHAGGRSYFCGSGCLQAFTADPDRFAASVR